MSIELLNGVSNVDGKRRVSASVKEASVNVDGKRRVSASVKEASVNVDGKMWVSSLRWANVYLTCMKV